jgi:RNA 3'-terminal phosphate cyclase (ATP)
MARLIAIDGAGTEGGGQVLRTALALSCATGQGFEMSRIRAGRMRPGLRPSHLGAVRAAQMISGARVSGAFEGSPDLRFEPGPIVPGEFHFDMSPAGAATLILQTVLVPLALASEGSRVRITGGTHVPGSPSFHYLSRHGAALLERLGLRVHLTLGMAGFHPKGGGEILARIEPWNAASAPALSLRERGRLVAVRGVSAAGRLRGGVAERQRDAARELLWESRRLEVAWETLDLTSASPGSFIQLEAVFENTCGALDRLGERGVRPEAVGDQLARTFLRFLDAEGAVDPHAADQLALPLALSPAGGVVRTTEVTAHLVTVAGTLRHFGIAAEVSGRVGGPGRLAVGSALTSAAPPA